MVHWNNIDSSSFTFKKTFEIISYIMDVLFFSSVCLFDKLNNETVVYGQYINRFNKVKTDNREFRVVFCKKRPDFLIRFSGKIDFINTISFCYDGGETTFNSLALIFPFENCDLTLNENSAIISTLCKNYSHRLDEWIQYNLKLGFSGIVIFNNDENNINSMQESLQYCKVNGSMKEICEKYKGKVFLANFPYNSFLGTHWDSLQRITLHIGVNAFLKKCRRIALIDADEFIYLPENPSANIEVFLNQYHSTISMQSNILTNKNNNDILDNNILELARYVGEDKYSKTILLSSQIEPDEFILTPHDHPTEIRLGKSKIIHYHCWMNERREYDESMEEITFLQQNP